jgi:hypothetical protein
VGSSQLLLDLARAVISGAESSGTHDHILLPQIWAPQPAGPGHPHLYPPGRSWSSYNPKLWAPFSSFLMTRRLRWRYSTSLHTVKVKVISRPTGRRPIYPGIRPPSGTCNQFFFLFHGNYLQTFALCYWGVLSDERMDLSFTVIAGFRQCGLLGYEPPGTHFFLVTLPPLVLKTQYRFQEFLKCWPVKRSIA